MKKLFLFIVLLTTILVAKAQSEENYYFIINPEKIYVNQPVTFTIKHPEDLDPDDIYWNFGDGSEYGWGFSCTHTYTKSGVYYLSVPNYFDGVFEILVHPSTSIKEPITINYEAKYEVYDVTGKFIGNNIKVLKNGIYFIKQKTNNKYLTKKIIIMNQN